MRGLDICKVWSRVPGLNDYWCQQIQWRISKDDELIGALTEPRYPCADNSLDTIILTQTVHLCQLFLHLQEFDPCATDTANSTVPNDELLCVFQDTLAREFNFAYDDRDRAQAGPAPVGEALERLVRGLMLAQRQEPQPQPPATASAPAAAAPPPTSSTPHRAQLQALLVRILRELNEPVDKNPLRYEQAYGPRRDDTWAARFATRVMQWRFTVKYAPASLVEEVIEVQRHDVHPLDDEGLEVYRILRCTAPGLIHIVTPLHPEIMQPQSQPPTTQTPGYSSESQQQHQQAASRSGMKVQQMLGTPLAQTPGSSASEGTDTPRTTPQYPQPPSTHVEGSNSSSSSSIKRGSEDDRGDIPPSKRPRPAEAETEAAAAAAANADEIVVRGGPMDIDTPQQQPPPTMPQRATAEETNALLRRAVDGIVELGRKIDGMQVTMDQRLGQLDEKLNKIFEWVGSED
ncbi:hypothetical protein N0V93_004376 [Gnomoniopsis smithogilvyi]|uniref:Uncharacterized protein n=1 Tax=Gnomoniopsis smithogilvyi TaxID=1191159 RepID=A0A9W8YSA2_9PEZI|nr:hypothetical protein N0V93_004376 [Gnomoniopsis smithogilvyi]